MNGLSCHIENAPTFADWITNRGGVAWWKSQDLSWPDRSWSTPATLRKGDCIGHEKDNDADTLVAYPPPHWSAPRPEIITDPERITVYRGREVDAFVIHLRVNIRSGYNARIELTKASTRKVERALSKAGEGSYYKFDGDGGLGLGNTDTVRIYRNEELGTLKDFIEGRIK